MNAEPTAVQLVLPPQVTSIVAQIPAWAQARAISVIALPEVISLNNTPYQIMVDGRLYHMRLAADTIRWLGVSRAEEGAAARAAAQAGICPPILYFDVAGNMVTPFIQGRHWEPHEFHAPANRARLVDLLRRLHAVKHVPADGSVFRRIERLIASAATLHVALPADLDRHLTALRAIEAARACDTRFRPGLSHNDWWANNMLDDGQRLWLVDWEFSGDGDGLFDLATVTLSSHATEAQRADLLVQYGYTAAEDGAQLHAMVYVVWCFEALWSLVQHGLRGAGDYDYQKHAQQMLQRMKAHLDG
jgi:thiamine kinase-like enzyme